MNTISLLEPILPKSHDTRIVWQNLPGDSIALAIAEAAKQHQAPIIVVTTDSLATSQLADHLDFFLGQEKTVPILQFPDWETLPYDNFSAHQDIVSQRLLCLSRLPSLKQGILLVEINNLMHRITPKQHMDAYSLALACGETIDIDSFRLRLDNCGYRCVEQVMEHGEFAVRGSILDIYPMGSTLPYRIDLFDDEIDSIRSFDPDNQLSIENIKQVELLPAKEYPLNEEGICCFRQQWREQFSGNPSQCPVYQDVSDGHSAAGIEYYLPLFFQQTATLFDYLPENSILIRDENVPQATEKFWQQILQRYEQLRHDTQRPILSPPQIFVPTQEIFAAMNQLKQIHVSAKIEQKHHMFACLDLPALQIDNKKEQPFLPLQQFMQQQKRVLFCTESAGRREALLELLQGIPLQPKLYANWADFIHDDAPVGIIIAWLSQGFQLSQHEIGIITEDQLFAQHSTQKRQRKTRQHDPQAMIRDLMELSVGTPIVHLDYGIGRYLGLQNLSINDEDAEFICLSYANDNKVYVPVTSLHLISRYSGAELEHVPLHQLGSKQWDKSKRKAVEKINDIAAELLDIYARRAAKPGYAFASADEQYHRFANAFPFTETIDQQQSISAVIEDMTSEKCMDRLVCGDVGFGKTEVAMRAAFLAAYAGKQVAIFVPTTLLAQQHYETLSDRFADWPIKIALLSRFQTTKQQKEIIQQLKSAHIDIVVGTHKLLNTDIQFKQLGLLIIDEEHRFGVRHKEKIRALRSDIDTLTLTATPIPRTLNMAFSGMRDLSIIATPPEKRLAIKTFVRERQHATIREAILRENMRGGQVYYLHNAVESIDRTAEELQELLPEIRVGIAHGQMPERQLERIMHEFYHQRFNVLVCTTIIESGIDIPTANTIIIDRADCFGLAQLHQIRGRVGRSHHQAYAYLFTPPERSITRDAKKRLEALTSMENLGAGFTLATHDLEIRGAGELLGEQQSGHIQAIGFTLYTELLKRAVSALKSGKQPDLESPLALGAEIDLQIPALIPDDYVGDVHTRLTLYKRVANALEQKALDELKVEFIDRFGLLPDSTKNLFAVTSLKLQGKPLGIRKIEANGKGGRIEFHPNPNIDPMLIIKLIQEKPDHYRLDGKDKLRFFFATDDAQQRLKTVKNILNMLNLRPH